ncbi:MAG: carboxypeptidase-like regulatory domain-containing protein [Planctomycetota bacterium]
MSRSKIALALLFAVLCAVVATIALQGAGSRASFDDGGASRARAADSTVPPHAGGPTPLATSDGERSAAPSTSERTPVEATTCSLGGTLEPVPGAQRPANWTAVLERRDRLGVYRDLAERAMGPDDADFRFEGLEPGVYAARAEAPGHVCGRTEVELVRPGHHVYVVLDVAPAAHLAGTVVLPDGNGAPGVACFLLRGTSERLEVRTDPVGRFRFDEVDPGRWRLALGDAVSPLVEPIVVDVPRSGADLPDVVLPALFVVRVRLVDFSGAGIPDVRLRGSGSAGGALDAVTDAYGRATAYVARPGRFRIRASDPLHGDISAAFDVPNDSEEVLIVVEPK